MGGFRSVGRRRRMEEEGNEVTSEGESGERWQEHASRVGRSCAVVMDFYCIGGERTKGAVFMTRVVASWTFDVFGARGVGIRA